MLNLLVGIFAGQTLLRARDQYEERAAQTTENLALTLEKELAGNIRSVDILLATVIDEFDRQRDSGSIDAPGLNDFIHRQVARFPYIDGIRVTDAAGILRYGSDVAADTRIDLSDRPHFRQLLDQHEDALVISKPQKSRANNKSVVVFARRIRNAEGSFGGMAFAAIAVEKLTQTVSQVAIRKGGSITLRGPDLGIIAHYPKPAGGGENVYTPTVAREFATLLATGATSGTFHASTPADGVERTLSFRKLGDYPLYLMVGRARSEYLGTWYAAAVRAAATLTLFLAVTVGLAVLVQRYWSRLAEANVELHHMAHTDFLTGLMNRRALLEAAAGELARARRYGSTVSVLMIDIDHFKAINDTLGHKAGDAVLQRLAGTIRQTLREVDLIGRWGGEEFVALLPETATTRAYEVAERVRQTIAETEMRNHDTPPVSLTVSVGLATLDHADETIDTLIARADAALYQAKEGGRNRVCSAEDRDSLSASAQG